MGKKTAEGRVLVDLYVPGFFTNKQIASLMQSLGAAIERNVGISRQWIFIQTHFPNQGQVYLSGEVQVWENYQGKVKPGESGGGGGMESIAPSVDW
jgi:hypothetical protein